MRFIVGVTAAIVFCALAAAGVQAAMDEKEILFAPVDQGANDANWQAYKARLLAALEKRNRQGVLAAIDPNVDNGPKEKRGVAEFRRRWDFDKDKTPVFDELRKALSLGGAYVKNERGQRRFCTPYVSAKWPTTHDPFQWGAITARDVLIKAEPASASRTLGTLTHMVVKVEDWEVADKTPELQQKWARIRFKDAAGYVPEEQIRSPIEHMACFSSDGGAWRLTSFTAGYLPE